MLATHQDAERRYDALRQAALNAATRQAHPSLGLDFKLICDQSLTESDKWGQSQKRQVDWDWIRGYPSFKFQYPKRFELALWQKGHLASLSLGRPTHNGSKLRLDFIERSTEHRQIQVFPFVLASLILYARALGANEVRVMNPINGKVSSYYSQFELLPATGSNYLFKVI